MGIAAILTLSGVLVGSEPPSPPDLPPPSATSDEATPTNSAPAPSSNEDASTEDIAAHDGIDDPWAGVPVQTVVPPSPEPISGELLDPWGPPRRRFVTHTLSDLPRVPGDLRDPFHGTASGPVESLAQAELRDPFEGLDMRLPAPHMDGPIPVFEQDDLRNPFEGSTLEDDPTAPCVMPSESASGLASELPSGWDPSAPPSTARCVESVVAPTET